MSKAHKTGKPDMADTDRYSTSNEHFKKDIVIFSG